MEHKIKYTITSIITSSHNYINYNTAVYYNVTVLHLTVPSTPHEKSLPPGKMSNPVTPVSE